MRIISKFKDYYDGGAVYGIDKERIYIRETKEISVPLLDTSNFNFEFYISKQREVSSFGYGIVGFCGETKEQYQRTVSLCKEVGFVEAYISKYSKRPLTTETKVMKDTVPYTEKKRRWLELDILINT